MLRVDAGIIGGTGIGERIQSLPGEVLHVPTTAGMVRGRLIPLGSKSAFAISRHSAGHKVPPHKVHYTAMALAMQALGVRACFATAAVGSLREDWGSGTLAACRDFLDVSGRFPTLFDRTVVHTDFSEPFSGREFILQSAGELQIPVQDGGVYVCGNGPRYETPEEIRAYRELGGDVVGMTAASEAIVMREAGVPYGCLALVTNLACGLSASPLSHGEVEAEMRKGGEKALELLLKAASFV